jgi:hypothetical protein
VTLCLEDSNRSLGHIVVKVTVGLVASLCCMFGFKFGVHITHSKTK